VGTPPIQHDRIDGHELALVALVEPDHAEDLREQREVLAESDVITRMNLGSELANQDGTALDDFAVEGLHAAVLGVGIAAVAGGARPFLVCHGAPLSP
jgi:hypothetical protein